MKKYFIMVLLLALPVMAWGQNKILSSAPNSDSLPVKQLEANIDFLMRELDILHKKIAALYPTYVDIAACGVLGQIYSPGAAAVGSKCVPVSGAPFVTEIKATSSSTLGLISSGTPSTRLQNFINTDCPTIAGWHVCTDDEVIFALDNRVTGATAPTTIINGTDTYWVRSLVPYRFAPTDTPGSPLASYSCSGWNSNVGTVYGTIFDGSRLYPRFTTGACNVSRKALCCR